MPLPTSLLPPQMASSPSTSSGRSDLPSSHSSHRQHNFKDVLVFDASGGVLSLRRITMEQRPREFGIPFSSPIASLATSISLPGVGATGRLSASPPSKDAARKQSGLTQQMLEGATELVGKESTIATWQLKRRHDWSEVKRVVHEVEVQPRPISTKFVPLAVDFLVLTTHAARSHKRNCRRARARWASSHAQSTSRINSCFITWARTTMHLFDDTDWPSRAPRLTCERKSRRAPFLALRISLRTWRLAPTMRTPDPTHTRDLKDMLHRRLTNRLRAR